MKLRLSLVAAACLAATSSFAAGEGLADAFTKGKVGGTVQAWYINDSFTSGNTGTSAGTTAKNSPAAKGTYALGGNLEYVTAPYYGILAGANFVSSNAMGQNLTASKMVGSPATASSTVVSSLAYNANVLEEAYVAGTYGKTTVKIGNQKLVTPLADSSDGARIFFNSFRAGVLINQDIPDTTFIAADVTAMLTRSGNVYGGLYSSTYAPGYSATASAAQTSINQGFQGMGQVAFGNLSNGTNALQTTLSSVGIQNGVTNGGSNPVYAFALVNSSLPGATLQAWYYNATDILQAWYFQGDYKYDFTKNLNAYFGAQYLYEGGIGATQRFVTNSTVGSLGYSCATSTGTDTACTGLKSQFFGAKLGANYDGWNAEIAYSTTPYLQSAFGNGSLIMPWGGTQTTLFTSTMTGNATAAGVQATKYSLGYNFDGVLNGLKAKAVYALYSGKTGATNNFFTSPTGTVTQQAGGNATSGGVATYNANMGYSATYGELKYQYNKPFSITWRVENDSLVGSSSSAPKSMMESRLYAVYAF